MMANFADSIRQLDVQVDQKKREQDLLDRENQELKIQLDALKHLESKFDQIRVSLEEETQRRMNSEKEADRLRTELNSVVNQSAEDTENLKRAVDDLRFQNEENINTINNRNNENQRLNQELLQTQHILGERDAELEDLRFQMGEVEKKNRALNDRINEIIFNKAAAYKEATLEALKKNPETGSPRGRRERQAQFGISDKSDQRLN